MKIRTAAAALAIALALAAPAHAAKRDNTVRWASNQVPESLDAYFNNVRIGVIIAHHIWDQLIYRDPKSNEYKPLLATSWKWADPKTLEIELRKGVRFHNGEAFDADDVVYTLIFVSNPANKAMTQQNVNWIDKARGAQVIDGTGAPPQRADIGIKGDRIVAFGDLGRARARTEIDAHRLIVAPGFIDLHSHLGDHELLRPNLAGCEPMLAQGVTTAFINADGWGVVDLASQRDLIEKAVPGLNAAPMIGHRAVRIAVLAFVNRPPGATELDRMRELVRTAFARDGAFGLSTGLVYPPANFAETDELIGLAKVTSEYGGFYHSHIRDESDGRTGWIPAIDELIRIAREAKVTGVVTHIIAGGPKTWGRSREAIARIEAARAAGVSVWADQYPYEASTTLLSACFCPDGHKPTARSAATPSRPARDACG